MPKSKARKGHSKKVAQRRMEVEHSQKRMHKKFKEQYEAHLAAQKEQKDKAIAALASGETPLSSSGALVSAVDGILVESED